MIGYYHHFGDYARDTIGLSLLEHGIYLHLIHWYYLHERPIPLNWEKASDLGALLRAGERVCMKGVLNRYFQESLDGWHHKRIDTEVNRYQQSAPKRMQRKANESTRQKRYRDWRSQAFEALRQAGCNMTWNASAFDLKDMLQRLNIKIAEGPESKYNPQAPLAAVTPATASETASHSVEGKNVTGWATTDSPEPYSLNPIPSRVTGHVDDGLAEAADAAPAPRVRVCVELRKLGLTSANSQDPRLQAALAEGATIEDFRSAAAQALAIKASNPWAYTLATVKGRIRNAQEGPKSGRGCTNAELVRAMVPGIAKNAPRPDFEKSAEVFDVDARRLD